MTVRHKQLTGVLNKLAGTTNLGSQAAANIWAGTQNTPLDLVGALNVKAGNGTNPSQWRDLRAVCNQLAGLHGPSGTSPGTDLDPLGALEHLAGQATW